MNITEKQKKLREKIVNYLIEFPIERGKVGCYADVAKKFNVKAEYIRDIYRKLRKAGSVEVKNVKIVNYPNDSFLVNEEIGKGLPYLSGIKEDVNKGTGDVSMISDRRIKSLKDLIEICEIDTNEWNIDWWECNKWEVGAKNKESKIEVTPLFQVKAKLSRRKLDNDLQKQKELIIEEIKNYKKPKGFTSAEGIMFNCVDPKSLCAYELNIPDLHIGKLAWKDETGEHYDLKIAVNRYKNAVEELLSRAPIQSIDKFILVIGNDMLNVDGKHNMTTNGTPQSSDGRFYKMVQVAKHLLIETIDKLAFHTEVDVIVVPGNHDNNSMLLLGDILAAWYHSTNRVKVFNEPTQRKYYQYGVNAFQYTHGNEEKHSDLGMIFAAEKPKLWADTKYRICKVGHFHKNKKIQYVSVDEYQGFQVQILPSLSGSDAWHASKGYNSLKQAKGFLYHKEKGQLAEYTYNV